MSTAWMATPRGLRLNWEFFRRTPTDCQRAFDEANTLDGLHRLTKADERQSMPKEHFCHRCAGFGGLDGKGGSSYIDNVILRDRDMTSAGGKVPFTGY